MIEKVVFFVLAFTILIVTIVKFIKRKDKTYIVLMLFETIGIIFQTTILNLSFAERNVDYNTISLFQYNYSVNCIYFREKENFFIRSNWNAFC